jgi:Ca-activated chloride channel family protein
VRKIFFIISTVVIGSVLHAQETEQHIFNGNALYRNKQYKEAEAEYKKALEKTPAPPEAWYNYASSLFRNENANAIGIFDSLAKADKGKPISARSFYNTGSMLSQQYEKVKPSAEMPSLASYTPNTITTSILIKSIDSYKEALRQNPVDSQARENLQKALVELKRIQPPPPEKKKDDQKKKQQQKKKEQRPRMNQKEVDQRLKLMEQKEKEVQQRVQKQKVKSSGAVSKDW